MDQRRFDEFRENARILLVEDAMSVRAQLKALLGKERIAENRLFEAPTGEEGLALFREAEPDLVFLDVMLPDRPGWDIGHEMLAQRPLANIVLLTALDRDHPRVRELVSDGIVAVLKKPVREGDVRNALLLVAGRTDEGHEDPFSDFASV